MADDKNIAYMYAVMDGDRFLAKYGFSPEFKKARVYHMPAQAKSMVTKLKTQSYNPRPNCRVVCLKVSMVEYK